MKELWFMGKTNFARVLRQLLFTTNILKGRDSFFKTLFCDPFAGVWDGLKVHTRTFRS